MIGLSAAAGRLIIEAVARERRAVGTQDAAGDDVGRALEELRRVAEVAIARATQEARDEFDNEEARFRRRWAATLQAGVGFDIAPLIASSDVADVLAVRAQATAALISSVTGELRQRIAVAALSGIYGESTDTVAREIQAATGHAFRRSRLIARDQMSKLHGDMNEFRQRQIGVDAYTWRTILDGRERAHHHDRNGKLYSWNKPPAGGHPGREINCRCRALAVITLPGESLEIEN